MYNQKFIQVVESLHIENAVTTIADALGVSKGSVSSYLSGKIKASKPFLQKFANKYNVPVNSITDTSSLYNEVSEVAIAPLGKSGRRKTGEGLVPYFDIDFAAGNSIMMLDAEMSKPEYYMDIPEFAGCTAFRAYSNSMEKKIKSGSILFATKVNEWQSHLEYGQIYGVICTDGRRYLKYIRKANESDCFLLRSENDDYDDFDLPKSAVRSIWLIHGWLVKRT